MIEHDRWIDRYQPTRLSVKFSLGLNRGCIWIGNFSGVFLSAYTLIDFATKTWAADTIMRPVLSDKDDFVESVHVTFSSCQAAK